MSSSLSFITRIFNHLLTDARRSGQVQQADLKGGARIYVRVAGSAGSQVTVTFARRGKRLGDTELTTFGAHCNIPASAERLPASGQAERQSTRIVNDEEHGSIPIAETWYAVGYRWRETDVTEHP
jgi:hypothetical protein